ncbi:MAG TPA: prolyl oligopeptidase family serine peptidase [Vicinamibacterales bacterium]|nr:prolyl oligopeptidase family serine peptidase [Vicinamibacterales bacterium]
MNAVSFFVERPLRLLCVVVALAGSAVCAAAQDATAFLPPRVRTDGVPPIPVSLVEQVAPYGDFRQARLLGWHPSERRLLIQTTFGNVPQIHDVRGPGAARTQLTFARTGVTGGAWYEPGGRYFVFRRDTGGGTEAMQLFRYDPTGAITLLTDGVSRNGEPVFSHRRAMLAYDSTHRDGKNRDLYVMDPSDPASARMLAQMTGNWSVLDWSFDDRQLLALEWISGLETHLWRVDVATGQKTAITRPGDPQSFWEAAQFAADGRSVFAMGDHGAEIPRIWNVDIATGQVKPVTADGDSIETFALSRDGKTLAVVVDQQGASRLKLLDASTGRSLSTPSLPPGVISALAWRPGGGELAIEYAGARTFRDVYSIVLPAGRVERWTTSEIGGANPESLPDAELVEWKSFDGQAISGILYRPSSRFQGPRPVIINVHGGPEARERPRALGRSNYFRNELGIAIIYPNIRGSLGFGRRFEHLDDGMKREDAVKDIGALLDWIATQPSLDKNRVMITGSSYGGYITLASAIAYGDRLRCAFEGFGITDFVTFLENTDESRRAERSREYGDPSDPKTREFLTRISPRQHASSLKIPLFIAQGAKDTRVPLGQAEEMVKAVKANGNPVWYVVYEDAGHEEFTRATNDYNIYAWVMFVRQFLLN